MLNYKSWIFRILKQLVTDRNSARITYDLMMHAAWYNLFTVCYASIVHSYNTDTDSQIATTSLAKCMNIHMAWQGYRTLVHGYLTNTDA